MVEKWILDFFQSQNENTLEQNEAKSLEFKVAELPKETI